MRLGILSFAHGHARSYAAAIARLPNVELRAVWDDDEARGRTAAADFATTYLADPEAVLDLDLDGVVVCAENARHRALVERAAGRTRAVLCEKPIATTLADAQAMIDACERGGTRLHTAFPVRFSPPVQRLKKLLDEEALGPVLSVACTNHGRMPGGWFVDPALAGGGAVLDHTVHVVDLLRWFWNTEVTEVFAEIGRELLHPGLGTDDAGMLSFSLANGVYGTLDTSWSRPASYPIWGDVVVHVVGERGAARVDAFSQNLTVTSDGRGGTQLVGWGSSADLGLLRDFTDRIGNDREPFISGHDGLKALEVALAAYRSEETGAVVALT